MPAKWELQFRTHLVPDRTRRSNNLCISRPLRLRFRRLSSRAVRLSLSRTAQHSKTCRFLLLCSESAQKALVVRAQLVRDDNLRMITPYSAPGCEVTNFETLVSWLLIVAAAIYLQDAGGTSHPPWAYQTQCPDALGAKTMAIRAGPSRSSCGTRGSHS